MKLLLANELPKAGEIAFGALLLISIFVFVYFVGKSITKTNNKINKSAPKRDSPAKT